MKIEFIKSPTGRFGLAYSSGETADVNDKLANALIEDGYAISLEDEKPESKKTTKSTKK